MADEPVRWGMAEQVEPILQSRLDADKRGGIPMEWVLWRFGYQAQVDGSRLVLPCPFHADSRPSFTIRVAEDGTELAGCWSCPDKAHGDLFDLIGWLTGVTEFAQVTAMLPGLRAQLAADTVWASMPRRVLAPPERQDPETLGALAASALAAVAADHSLLQQLIDWKRDTDKGWQHLTPGYLMREWRVGIVPDRTETRQVSNPDSAPYDSYTRLVRGQQIVVPHFDAAGLCRGLKTRYVGGKLYSMRGSDLSSLYGAWRPRRFDTAVLCEGESDAWITDRLAGDRMDVYALPYGAAGPKPEWLDFLAGRRVLLAFDGDEAGQKATKLWTK